VVIAIIAILAAILFPVFAQAREKARMAACLSNTKQIALAIQMYAGDYDETLPVSGSSTQCRGRWFHQIMPYVKNNHVFTCPNIPENRVSGPPADLCTAGTDRAGFGWNSALGSSGLSGYTLAEIAKPASTLIAGDSGLPSVSGGPGVGGWIIPPYDPRVRVAESTDFPNPNTIASYAQFRHHMTKSARVTVGSATYTMPLEGRCTFVFLDGHSKTLSPDTAFEKAKGTPPTEDGNTCSAASTTSSRPDTRFSGMLGQVKTWLFLT
jgi:hypothetical protein